MRAKAVPAEAEAQLLYLTPPVRGQQVHREAEVHYAAAAIWC